MNIRWSECVVASTVAVWLGLFSLWSCSPPPPNRPEAAVAQQAEQAEPAPPAYGAGPGVRRN